MNRSLNRSLSHTADIEQLDAQSADRRAVGDRWFVGTLVFPDLRRYAQRHCHASYAEDAMQETLLVVTSIWRIETIQLGDSMDVHYPQLRQCYAMFRQLHIDLHVEDEAWAAMIDAKPAAELRLDLIAALESLPHHHLQVIFTSF